MSAMRTESTKRPPMFTTYAEVEVDVDPEDLERAGWVYVGKKKGQDVEVTTEHVLTTVRRWHDDNHDGPWMWCSHDLCDQLRGRPHDGTGR